MAQQFQMWGSWDMGFKIDFTVGKVDRLQHRITGIPDDVYVVADRKVTAHLPTFVYKDASGTEYANSDCFQVDLEITQDPNPPKQER
jgi:hypothetical protein